MVDLRRLLWKNGIHYYQSYFWFIGDVVKIKFIDIIKTISYILSGAIYGYNVYDAISSKGAKIYAFTDDVGIFLTLAQGNNQVPQLSVSIDL